MKQTIFILLALLNLPTLKAQNFYTEIFAGYGLGGAREGLADTKASYNSGGGTYSFNSKPFSLGAGIQPGVSLGYIFSSGIGAGISVSYIMGNGHKITDEYNSIDQTSKTVSTHKASAIRVIPHLRLETKLKGVQV